MENRITDFEIQLTHAEASIDSLNTTVYQQQKQIDDLTRQIEIMKEYIKGIGQQMSQIAPASDEPPPPHY